MDLPPSGWYPDPYGVPGLLRWWDGSTWTQHTHPDGPETTDTAQPATTVEPAKNLILDTVGVALAAADRKISRSRWWDRSRARKLTRN